MQTKRQRDEQNEHPHADAIAMMVRHNKHPALKPIPRIGPIVNYRDRWFQADPVAGRFRNLANPGDTVPFETRLGRQMRQIAGIRRCDHCRQYVVVSETHPAQVEVGANRRA